MTSENHSPSAITEFAAEPNYVIVLTRIAQYGNLLWQAARVTA
jgi:hypothetical protein